MSLAIIDPYKSQIIKIMPVLALSLIVIGYFLPVSIGVKALYAFILGLIGRIIFPYYMKWKENEEELMFNYAYLLPIIILIVTGVFAGLSGFSVYLELLLGTEPIYLVYFGALVFAYGGYDLFNGFKKWMYFLEGIWTEAQIEAFEEIGNVTISSDGSGMTIEEEKDEEPTVEAEDYDTHKPENPW